MHFVKEQVLHCASIFTGNNMFGEIGQLVFHVFHTLFSPEIKKENHYT